MNELQHVGVLGMKWRTHTSRETVSPSEQHKDTQKKILAIAAVATVAVAGAAYLKNKKQVDSFVLSAFKKGTKLSEVSAKSSTAVGKEHVSEIFKKIQAAQHEEAQYHIKNLTEELNSTKNNLKKASSPSSVKTFRENMNEIQASISSWEKLYAQSPVRG